MKLDILGYDVSSMIRHLQDITAVEGLPDYDADAHAQDDKERAQDTYGENEKCYRQSTGTSEGGVLVSGHAFAQPGHKGATPTVSWLWGLGETRGSFLSSSKIGRASCRERV